MLTPAQIEDQDSPEPEPEPEAAGDAAAAEEVSQALGAGHDCHCMLLEEQHSS